MKKEDNKKEEVKKVDNKNNQAKKSTPKKNNSKSNNNTKKVTQIKNDNKEKTSTEIKKDITETKKKKNKKKAKDEKQNKFVETIKKKWLIDGTKTFFLVVIIIAAFIALNLFMKSLNLTPIDFSQDKLYTLSDETKDKVKDVEKDVKIYFVGYDDTDSNLDLAKQFKNVNEHITAEAVNVTDRPDLATKYGIQSGTQGIIVESGNSSKVLTANDLTTYDTSSSSTISIAEEKLTSAILSVVSNKTPKVYFLSGYSNFSLDNNMNYLKTYLANEVMTVGTLDLISVGKVPDDCDTLVITTPSKDFDEVATNAIIDYIKSGRNILWFNAAESAKKDLPNVNKVLAEYGVNPFDVGIIRETDSSKMASNQPDIIIPTIEYSKITKDIYNTTGVLFINATKINLSDSSKLKELNVTSTELLKASEASYFRTDFTIQSQAAQEGEAKGTFVVGAELDKTIEAKNEETGTPAKVSKLVIYGENYFISDYPLSSSTSSPVLQYAYNKDLAINSMAYLVDREEDITTRKNTGTVTYTATDEQNSIILVTIFAVPVAIIVAGIVVWQVRRRKK